MGVFELNDAGQVILWRDSFDATSFTDQLTALDA